MQVKGVLWDADGVLQVLPRFEELWPFLADDVRAAFVADVFADLPVALTGRRDMSAHLDATIAHHGLGEHVQQIRAVFTEFRHVEDAIATLAAVRASGTTCVLATNQDSLREQHMRPLYEPLVDRCYFSASMGLAKPDAAFFARIAADLGVQPVEMLFIDDGADNVEGARAAGLRAEQWHHDDGMAALHAALARHGLSASS